MIDEGTDNKGNKDMGIEVAKKDKNNAFKSAVSKLGVVRALGGSKKKRPPFSLGFNGLKVRGTPNTAKMQVGCHDLSGHDLTV